MSEMSPCQAKRTSRNVNDDGVNIIMIYVQRLKLKQKTPALILKQLRGTSTCSTN